MIFVISTTCSTRLDIKTLNWKLKNFFDPCGIPSPKKLKIKISKFQVCRTTQESDLINMEVKSSVNFVKRKWWNRQSSFAKTCEWIQYWWSYALLTFSRLYASLFSFMIDVFGVVEKLQNKGMNHKWIIFIENFQN